MYHQNQAWRPLFQCCIRRTKQAQSQAHGGRQGFTAAVRATLIAGAILTMLMPSDAGGAQKFGMADLTGTWNVHMLTSLGKDMWVGTMYDGGGGYG